MTAAPRPFVSVAIRAYRREWLHGAIASVLAQTYDDLELVVYDDAGTLLDIVEQFDDPRIRYHRAPVHVGPSGRFKAAVALCRGELIGILDDDDRYEPEFVARLVPILAANPDVGMVFCRVAWDMGGVVHPSPDRLAGGRHPDPGPALVGMRLIIPPSRMLLRRTAFDDTQRLLRLPDDVSPDVFLTSTMAAAGWAFWHVAEVLATCGWHEGQASRGSSARDRAILTWQELAFADPSLERIRREMLERSLFARAAYRAAAGDRRGAGDDVRAAGETGTTARRSHRRALRGLLLTGPLGRVILRAALARYDRRQRPMALPGNS